MLELERNKHSWLRFLCRECFVPTLGMNGSLAGNNSGDAYACMKQREARKNLIFNKKKAKIFGSFTEKLYLCSRFPRNRWQEVSRDLLCCAWNDTAKIKN